MSQNVEIKLIFNAKTGEITTAQKQLTKLSSTADKAGASANKSSSAFSSFGASVGKLAAVAGVAVGVGALVSAMKQAASASINLNASLEDITRQLTAMVYINTQNTTTTGKAVSAQEKYALATQEASKHLDTLQDLAARAGYGINDLAEAYKAYGQGAVRAMDFEQMQKSFEALTIAARGAGTDIETLKFGLDNLATGTVVESSALGVFIKSLGMSNEMLKEAINQGTLYELIMQKTAPAVEAAAQSSQTYTQALGALKTAWNGILQEGGAKYFESIKKSVNEITNALKTYKEAILSFIDESIEFGKFYYANVIEPLWDLVRLIYDYVINALNALVRAFASANSEITIFEALINGIKLAFVGFKMMCKDIEYALKDFVNVFAQIIANVEYGWVKLTSVISGGSTERLAAIKAEIKALESERAAIYGIHKYEESMISLQIDEILNGKKELEKSIETLAQMPDGNDSLKQNPFQKSGIDALKKSTKEQIDTLKSWWDTEFNLREKNIELMKEGKDKELAAEKLRFDKVISNLNFEIQKKLQSGEITEQQALALYKIEEQLHEKKMKNIAEYSAAYENLKSNINSALEENITNALTGKFSSTKDFFKDLFSSMQTSFTQGLAQSMAQALMSSQVMEGFTKTFSTAIEGVSSLFGSGATGGLANVAGEASATSGAQLFGSVAAGAVTGFSFGNMVYNSVNDGFTSKADKWRNAGIGVSALAGAAGGAAIGSAVPVIGTAIGSVVGGIVGGVSAALGFAAFGSKLEQTGQGLQLWAKGTKDDLNASLYADMKQTTKKWWKKSSKEWTEYYAADTQSLINVRNAFRSYEWFLQDLGVGVKEIAVSAGRYDGYVSVANAGARAFINAYLAGLNVDTNAIYNAWASYASSVNKSVSEALSESLQKYVDSGNSFEAWKLEFEGKSVEAAKFNADLAKKQVDRILETLGAENVTIDNFMAFREEALKTSFDPQTIERINLLGEYLMSASEASKKYEEALKDETKTKLNLIDPFLSKARKLDEISTDNADTSEKLLVSILSTLKQSLRVSQENQNELLNGKLAPALARV